MTVSLRARLILGVVALAAAALLVMGAITYAEQRDFLYDRVDQQTRAAVPAVARALADKGIGGGRAGGPGGGPRVPGGAAGRPDGPGDHDDSPARGGPGDVSLPPGTYGQLRDASGRVLGSVVLTYDQQAPPAPALPAALAGASGARSPQAARRTCATACTRRARPAAPG